MHQNACPQHTFSLLSPSWSTGDPVNVIIGCGQVQHTWSNSSFSQPLACTQRRQVGSTCDEVAYYEALLVPEGCCTCALTLPLAWLEAVEEEEYHFEDDEQEYQKFLAMVQLEPADLVDDHNQGDADKENDVSGATTSRRSHSMHSMVCGETRWQR
jgi:hypothetical protein